MNADSTTRKQFRFTGWHMLAVMLLFFGTIISVNFFMARSAFTAWTGLVVKNSYVASQEFNAKLHSARAQQDLNLTDAVAYANGLVLFTLNQPDGTSVTLTNAKVTVGRPAYIGADVLLDLSQAKDGSYFVTHLLDDGDWLAIVTGHLEGFGPWKMEHRLSIEGARSEN